VAIRAGQLLHTVDGFLIDRIQTAGAGNLNIPQEKIEELGNYQTVGLVRDTPDLSFDLESLDFTTEFEAILVGEDPTSLVDGDDIDYADCAPIDVVAPFKDQGKVFTTVKGVIVPELVLESATYNFAVKSNATKRFTFRSDGIFYTQGTPYSQVFAAAGTGPYTYAHTALPYVESAETRYVVNARLVLTSGATQRLVFGVDYTTTSTVLTLTAAAPAGSSLEIVYGSATAASFLQSVHPLTSGGGGAKPAAARPKDIRVYVGPQGGSLTRWLGVQTADVNWKITLDRDEELGNTQIVSSDYDVAEVTGTIAIRAASVSYLFDRIAQVTDTATSGVIAGALSSVLLQVQIEIADTVSGDVIQTLYVPDARFEPPAIQGRVQQKIEAPFPWTSESGTLLVYKGERTDS
jgi:hypothetical protein